MRSCSCLKSAIFKLSDRAELFCTRARKRWQKLVDFDRRYRIKNKLHPLPNFLFLCDQIWSQWWLAALVRCVANVADVGYTPSQRWSGADLDLSDVYQHCPIDWQDDRKAIISAAIIKQLVVSVEDEAIPSDYCYAMQWADVRNETTYLRCRLFNAFASQLCSAIGTEEMKLSMEFIQLIIHLQYKIICLSRYVLWELNTTIFSKK